MEAGNQQGFKRRFSSFSNYLWSLIMDSPLLASDALSANIANLYPVLLSLYFTVAAQIAVVSLQIQHKLPLSFAILAICTLLGFACLLVAKLAEFKTPKPARLLHLLALLFLDIAFFVAISIPFRFYFTIMALTVFLGTLAIVIYSIIIPKTNSLLPITQPK